tara:strand:+ start:2217 stop:2423 length:207 start_codon:yes stop_codon:yes gene_type:complete
MRSNKMNTVKEIIKTLSEYNSDTRVDIVLLGEDEENSTDDTYLTIKGIVGSGETEVSYIEIGVKENER